MLSSEQKSKFMSLCVEIIDLNILAYFYTEKLNNLANLFQKSTRQKVMEEFIALRYMENGIILHLTNLDDDSSDFSFKAVLKEINKGTLNVKEKKMITNRVGIYRKKINNLKTKHRNIRIAHLNYLEDLRIDEFLEYDNYIKLLIIYANEIGDLLWGEKIEMKFRLGSLEGIINFRDRFECSKFNR
ncbi:hypothetical protein AAEO56_08560 [Flavobacterium sp. DGU11]|uniref:HEPN AbiU2-like domain-containing protein n=1 Tax=Flavobacterium arundinis TaxID=3139143 RepID=A0ABU9HVW8_9FLAO